MTKTSQRNLWTVQSGLSRRVSTRAPVLTGDPDKDVAEHLEAVQHGLAGGKVGVNFQPPQLRTGLHHPAAEQSTPQPPHSQSPAQPHGSCVSVGMSTEVSLGVPVGVPVGVSVGVPVGVPEECL